jgi:hypothetical protein
VAEIRSYCIEPVWEQSPPLLPEKEANNPPGCHRSRISGWIVFEKLLQVFGCAYSRIADEECLDTTLRRRRDEYSGAKPSIPSESRALALISSRAYRGQ